MNPWIPAALTSVGMSVAALVFMMRLAFTMGQTLTDQKNAIDAVAKQVAELAPARTILHSIPDMREMVNDVRDALEGLAKRLTESESKAIERHGEIKERVRVLEEKRSRDDIRAVVRPGPRSSDPRDGE